MTGKIYVVGGGLAGCEAAWQVLTPHGAVYTNANLKRISLAGGLIRRWWERVCPKGVGGCERGEVRG